ncbi:MAG: carboxypeptidase regulatory-like domain-containing protein [Acidobacteriaceae bacterium]
MFLHKVTTAISYLCFLFIVIPLLAVEAQTHHDFAQIQGVLTDHTGAVVIGATVLVHSETTGRTWFAITGTNGDYMIVGLPAGNYEVRVHQEGFAESVKSITVPVGGTINMPITLGLAAIVQQMSINSGPVDASIDSQQIGESPARDLGEAMKDVPGVEMARKAGINNDVAVRGMLHSDLAKTIDGAHLYGACTSQMDPAVSHVDLSEVDHVDIVKGPFDVTTQGSLGGFVKVVTKTPDENGLEVAANVLAGSYGYYNPSLTVQAGNKTLHFLAGYSFSTSEMYRDGNGIKVSTLASYRNGDENLQAFRTQSGWTKLAFQPNQDQQVEMAYIRQQGGEVLYPFMLMDGIFDHTDRFTGRYDYIKSHELFRSIHGLVYVNKINHLMDDRLRTSAWELPYSMSAQVVSYTTGGRIDADLTQNMTAGFESYRRYWNSNNVMISKGVGGTGGSMTSYSKALPGVTENVNGAYFKFLRSLNKKLLLSSGVRYDYSYTNASNANPALYEAYHGTSKVEANDSGVSGNVRLTMQTSEWTSVFVGMGSNIRFPDPEERYFIKDSPKGGWVGDPLLTHPRNTEYDLGITAKRGRYTLAPLVFFSDLDNYITLYSAYRMVPVTGVKSNTAETYANIEAHQWGGEITGSASISPSLVAYASFTYDRGTKVPQPANNMYSSNLFQVPPPTGQVDIRYERKNLYSELQGTITGRFDHVDTDENEKITAGYSILNWKAGHRVGRINMEAGLNNMLDREYTEFLSYSRNPYNNNGLLLPDPGRNFFVSISCSLERHAN